MSWTQEEVKDLAERILSFSKADECDVTFEAEDSAHTRFAANDVTTSGFSETLTISIASRGKGKSGTVRTSETDPDALKRAVARSEELMDLAPVDPEYVEGLGPQSYAAIAAWLHENQALAAVGNPYVASQGREIGRDGRVEVRVDADGEVWIGGCTQTVIRGTLDW